MIVANKPYTNQLYLQKSTWFLFTSVYYDDTKILQFSQKHFQQKKDLSKYPARKCECKNKLKEQGGEQEKGKS